MNWTAKDIKDKKLVETDKGFVHADKLTSKKVDKINPDVNSFGKALKEFHKNIDPYDAILDVKESSSNKKIRNATKTTVDGIVFDSKLEATMYGLLKGAKITFNRQVEYVLQPGFKYRGKAVRPIKSYVDFFLPKQNMIIDCKGYANDIAPLKFKLLKFYFYTTQFNEPQIEMPRNRKECELLINKLMYDK